MKDIADALNISRVTVSKAFNNQMGVSDSLRELIFEKARELGYTKLPYQVAEPPERGEHTISLVVSRPDSALFWTQKNSACLLFLQMAMWMELSWLMYMTLIS